MALQYPQAIDLAYKLSVQYEEQMGDGSWRGISHPIVAPGLLQVETYAEAILRFWGHRDSRLKQLVDFRQARQDLMRHRVEVGSQYSILLPEQVFTRLIGSPDVMAEQMEHLELLAGVPGITIQVFPFSAGVFEGCDTAFEVTELAERYGVVYIEQTPNGRLLRQPDEVRRFRELYDLALERALSPDDSLGMIRQYSERWRAA